MTNPSERRIGGYAVITEPDKPTWERDTVSCKHCGRVIYVKPGTASTVYQILHWDGHWTEEPGAWCACCHGPVCLPCHDVGTCTPIEKMLAEMERRV